MYYLGQAIKSLRNESREFLLNEAGKLGGVVSQEIFSDLSLNAPARGSTYRPERHVYKVEGIVPTPAAKLFLCFSLGLNLIGKLDLEPDPSNRYPTATGTVMSGFLGMNPAWLEISVRPVSETESEFFIVGSAREGLIHQKTAEKAVERLLSLFDLPGVNSSSPDQ